MNQRVIAAAIGFLSLALLDGLPAAAQLLDRPAERVSGGEWFRIARPELAEISRKVLAMPDIPLQAREEMIRIRVLEMDWDIAAMVYEPVDPAKIPTGADGRKVGLFLLHGGSGDHRSMDRLARFLTSKFGYKIVNMSVPGRVVAGNPGGTGPRGIGFSRLPVGV